LERLGSHPLRVQCGSHSRFESGSFGGWLHPKPCRRLEDLQRIVVGFEADIGFGEPQVREVLRLEVGAVRGYRHTGLRSLLDCTSEELGGPLRLAVPERLFAVGVQFVPFLSSGGFGREASQEHQHRYEGAPAAEGTRRRAARVAMLATLWTGEYGHGQAHASWRGMVVPFKR
jgi:hypothetical protein